MTTHCAQTDLGALVERRIFVLIAQPRYTKSAEPTSAGIWRGPCTSYRVDVVEAFVCQSAGYGVAPLGYKMPATARLKAKSISLSKQHLS